jgi:hypothetical protein
MIWLALLGCVGRQEHVRQVVEAGWGEQVFAPMRWRERSEHTETVWRMADVTLSMEVVPVEAFGVAPRGYGETWWMIGVGLDRRRGLASEMTVRPVFDTLTTCTTCDERWIRNQMASPHLPPERAPSTGGGRRRTGLGRLLGGLADVGKLVGSIILMPVALGADLTLAVTGASTRKGSAIKPFGLTKYTWSIMTGVGDPAAGVGTAAPVPDRGFVCAEDRPCTASWVVQGEEPPTALTLSVGLVAGAMRTQRIVTLPMSGHDLEASLSAAVPSDGLRLDLTRSEP